MRMSPLAWSFAQQAGRLVTGYAIFAALALLLAPEDFGLVGMAMVWIAFMATFAELGFGVAVIQRADLSRSHLSSTFFLNVGLGIVISLVGLALAKPAAVFFRTPAVTPVLAVLSVSFTVNALSLTQSAVAQREFRFRELAIRDISASLLGGAIGIVLAIEGAGVWSLVARNLAVCSFNTILLWRLIPWRPRWSEMSWPRVRELWPYSSQILAFNIFKFFSQNTDRVLIGALLGPGPMGVYVFATSLIVTPVAGFRSALGAYLFPKFSRQQDDLLAVRSTYLFSSKVANAVVMPVMVLAVASAPAIIQLVFGTKWRPAVPVIQILTVVAVSQTLLSPVGELMKALNRPGWLFRWGVFFDVMMAVSLVIGARYGLEGAVVGLAAAYVLSLPVMYVIGSRLIPLRPSAVMGTLSSTLVASLVLGSLVIASLSIDHTHVLPVLVLSGVTGLAAYGLLMRWLDPPFVAEVVARLARV